MTVVAIWKIGYNIRRHQSESCNNIKPTIRIMNILLKNFLTTTWKKAWLGYTEKVLRSGMEKESRIFKLIHIYLNCNLLFLLIFSVTLQNKYIRFGIKRDPNLRSFSTNDVGVVVLKVYAIFEIIFWFPGCILVPLSMVF